MRDETQRSSNWLAGIFVLLLIAVVMGGYVIYNDHANQEQVQSCIKHIHLYGEAVMPSEAQVDACRAEY